MGRAEYEPEDEPDEDDLHFVVNDSDTLTEGDSDYEEDEDSDIEVMNPEVWKAARQANQQPSTAEASQGSKKRKIEADFQDPADALFAELYQKVVDVSASFCENMIQPLSTPMMICAVGVRS